MCEYGFSVITLSIRCKRFFRIFSHRTDTRIKLFRSHFVTVRCSSGYIVFFLSISDNNMNALPMKDERFWGIQVSDNQAIPPP